MSLKLLLYWIPMIAIAFINAALRELVLIKHFSNLRAHQLSTLTLIILCAVYIWFISPRLAIRDAGTGVFAGLLWVTLTVAFEFTFGRLSGKSWAQLLHDYNLMEGRLWPVFLFCLLLLPWVVYMLRSK